MSELIIIILAAGTLLVSLIDVLINGYIGYKKKHFHSECFKCCSVDYDSDSNTEKKDENLTKTQ